MRRHWRPNASAITRWTVVGVHRRGGFLELRERVSVRPRHLFGEGRLEDAHGLAELHGPALELAEHPEDLLGRRALDLGGHEVSRPPADPLAHAERGASGEPDGERASFAVRVTSATRQLGHEPIVDPPQAQPQ